jgi:hypothetical protein
VSLLRFSCAPLQQAFQSIVYYRRVDSANNYKDSTVDFANDWTVKAVTTLTTTTAGTYAVSSELDVLKLNLR